MFSNWAQVWTPDCAGRQGVPTTGQSTTYLRPSLRPGSTLRLAQGLGLCLPDAREPRGQRSCGGATGGELAASWGDLGASVGTPLTTPVPCSPAVLADNVLLGPNDRGADAGHVQRTPSWPFSQQPRGPQAGHHQRDGGSRGRREAQPPPARRAVAPESHGAAPSPPPTPLLQVIPNYSSRTEYEKLFAMGVTM